MKRAHLVTPLLMLLTALALGQTANAASSPSSATSNLSTTSLKFGSNVPVGGTVSQNMTVSNSGSQILNIYTINPPYGSSPFYVQMNPCNFFVSAGKRCSFTTYFNPTTTGTFKQQMVIQTNTPNGSPTPQACTLTSAGGNQVSGYCQIVSLSGTVVSPVTLLPSNVSFGNVNIGVMSSSQTVKLTNNGSKSISHIGISASTNFVIPNDNCGSNLSGSGSHCNIGIAFKPTMAGLINGTLTVNYTNSTGTAASLQAALSGTGVSQTKTQTGIVINPPSATINTGDSQQFTAYPTYSDGTTGTIPVATSWSSSNRSVGQVDVNGVAVGDAGGTATITAVSGAFTSNATVNVSAANACLTNNRTDMKVLVITNGKGEADYLAITGALNYLHMPFDIFDYSTGSAITAGMLNSGCHAFYNGVIVAFLDGGTINPPWDPTGVPFAGWDVLQTFEKTFNVRQLNWFGYPAPILGFSGYTDYSQAGHTGTYNQAAATVFPYVNETTPLRIDPTAFTVVGDADSGTALITDANNHALSLSYVVGDGREFLTNTFDSNQYMRHNIILSYGLVNWVTKGLFLGEKHIFFTPQEDDWGIDDDIWARNNASYLAIQGATPPTVGSYPTCTNPVNTVTGMAQRISASDAQAFLNWQTNVLQSNRLFTNVKLYNAFNSCGMVPSGGRDPNCGSNASPYTNDTLTAWTKDTSNSSHFGWINHTYEHEDLMVQGDGTSPQTYAVDYFQINQNIQQEQLLGFADFNKSYMVTPDISGLDYLPALQAMVDNGVQYVVSDTSCGTEKSNSSTCFAGINNGPGPGFNLPIVNSNNPITGSINTGNIYEIPRRPSNLFYNVGTPDGWQSEYDCIYTNLGGTDPSGQVYGTYTTQDIMDFIAGKKGVYPNFVDLMMQGDADPEMFHQTNLTAYDGTNSLLSDLLGEAFNLYQSYFNLPVKSMDMGALGQFMLNNQAMDSSGIVGTVNNGSSRTVTLTVTNAATIPVTGLGNQVSPTTEHYGTQFISHAPMTAGETLTQPAP